MQKKDIIIKLLGDWAKEKINQWKDNKCTNFLIVHVTFLTLSSFENVKKIP